MTQQDKNQQKHFLDDFAYLASQTNFNKEVSRLENKDEQGDQRIFTKAQKDLCWNNATSIPGRDPKRWKFDPVGNPIVYGLRGCMGALCHEYDHIVPFSKGGKTVVENCQVLQTSVNRWKSNKVNVPLMELNDSSKKLRLTHQEMDLIEYGIYGNYG